MSEIKKQNEVITVAVVDDDVNVRDGLRWLLNNCIGMRCLGTYACLPEAMTGMKLQPPKILLLDVNMPDTSGIDGIRPIRAQLPSVKIIMHSNYDDDDKIVRSMQAGASGYILKNASAPMLYEAIWKVHQGGSVWPAGYTESNLAKSARNQTHALDAFTQKARAILRAVREVFIF